MIRRIKTDKKTIEYLIFRIKGKAYEIDVPLSSLSTDYVQGAKYTRRQILDLLEEAKNQYDDVCYWDDYEFGSDMTFIADACKPMKEEIKKETDEEDDDTEWSIEKEYERQEIAMGAH